MPSVWSRWLPPRQTAALAVATLVVVLHAALLGGLAPGAGPGWRAEPTRAVQVRHIVQAADGPKVQPEAPAPLVPMPVETQPVVLARRAPPAATATATATAQVSEEAISQPASEPDIAVPLQAPAGGQPVPVYATRLPPASTLQFEWRRGLAVGIAELDWQPAAGHYHLTLQAQAPRAPTQGWTSQGGFDAAGIAPVRYTESRRGRDLRAANFQRDSGRVSFSGPAIEHTLVPGGQDRLSWMLQLAAVVAANPALAEPEAQVSIWVVGTRGDATVWTFTVQGSAALDLPAGRVEAALLLTREPQRPYDTQVQVWLDPARHHLPVQALLRVRGTGEGSEFRLLALK